MHHLNFVVYRQEKIEPGPIVLIRSYVDESIKNSDDLRKELCICVEQWAINTEQGRNCYDYAGDDMNIGDIAAMGDMDSIISYSDKIQKFHVEYLNRADDWVFDSPLCSQIEALEE